MKILTALLTLVAIALWFFIFKNGNANSLRATDTAVQVTSGGSPSQGRETMITVGCAGCHEIPGVETAHGHVGPPLKGFATRAMIAGVLANNAPNLIQWLQHPRAIDEKTAMPDLGLSEDQARDIAAYLYAH